MLDVFSQDPFCGNPLAAVFDADELSTDEMQHLTRWFNLSETVFFQKPSHPEADYKVRIFTLNRELPFAGHPTLGSCQAWLTAGGKPKRDAVVVQECGAGLIHIQQTDDRLAFAAPDMLRSGAVSDDELDKICNILGIGRKDIKASNWIDNGPGWVGLLLESAEKVLSIKANATPDDIFDIGIIGPYPKGSECDFELRALFSVPDDGLREDPVTGSLNASMAQWLMGTGHAPDTYVASQGTLLQRKGRIYLERDKSGQVWVGGHSTVRVKGEIELADL
ncbi:MAG: PhzF family phenazine biosynthesis protein [Gammaproteobacteria bacterium]|nr:PhzF family phenazine biosynthesis protein [Gammaproteobacteria bacterium]NNC97750.1 PhzF family phenazine biosynthesis protein [Gammaproteobacteria bacterium]NNM13259.1 PhzF family phenazine biosynthesis protein [Gammaproteobacteria bacterium]